MDRRIVHIASEISSMTPDRRKTWIIGKIPHFDQLNDQNQLEKSRAISEVINSFASDYFDLRIDRDLQPSGESTLSEARLRLAFSEICAEFLPRVINDIQDRMPTPDMLKKSSKNIYQLAGASKLSAANRITRTISTKLGSLWEAMATVSPYAICPELEFGLKIRGIDLIARNVSSGDIEYHQLKTQRNTLTGSQKPRSVSELLVHDNPVFCACLSTNAPWTFNHPKIPRVVGSEFWSRISISYDVVVSCVVPLILELEAAAVGMLVGDDN